MLRIIILSGVDHSFKVYRLQVVELLLYLLFLHSICTRYMVLVYMWSDLITQQPEVCKL